jgi:GntR family transcriptional regulator
MNLSGLERSASLSQQLLGILTERIRRGIYPPESRFPSQNELAAEFNVSRATIRSALDTLASRRLVVRRQGVGTFVSTTSRIANPLDRPVLFQDLIASNGYRPGVQFVGAERIRPGAKLAGQLETEEMTPLLQLQKVFTADEDPVIYCINTLPPWVADDKIVEEVLRDPSLTEPIFEFLERRCDQPLKYYVATIRPDFAANCPIQTTSFDPETLAMVIDEVGYNAQERPILHSLHYYPGSLMSFELIRTRDYTPAGARIG